MKPDILRYDNLIVVVVVVDDDVVDVVVVVVVVFLMLILQITSNKVQTRYMCGYALDTNIEVEYIVLPARHSRGTPIAMVTV